MIYHFLRCKPQQVPTFLLASCHGWNPSLLWGHEMVAQRKFSVEDVAFLLRAPVYKRLTWHSIPVGLCYDWKFAYSLWKLLFVFPDTLFFVPVETISCYCYFSWFFLCCYYWRWLWKWLLWWNQHYSWHSNTPFGFFPCSSMARRNFTITLIFFPLLLNIQPFDSLIFLRLLYLLFWGKRVSIVCVKHLNILPSSVPWQFYCVLNVISFHYTILTGVVILW